MIEQTFMNEETDTKEYQELMAMYDLYSPISANIGDVFEATYDGEYLDTYIFSVTGLKDYIRVSKNQKETYYIENLEKGDTIDLMISTLRDDDNSFLIGGSVYDLHLHQAQKHMDDLDKSVPVLAYIKESNPAGYSLEIIHGAVRLPAFMPNTLAGVNKLSDPESIVGQTLDVMIESFSEREGTYIASRKRYLKTLIPEAIKELSYDNPYRGHVTGVTDFGIFVEFNKCLTGLIYKSNINPEWTDRIHEIKPGFQIEFYVKEIFQQTNRSAKIILTQILDDTIWDIIEEGHVIEGTVDEIKDFGILVRLDDTTRGLIFESEFKKVNRSFNKEDKINVKILSIDRADRKIFLTIA